MSIPFVWLSLGWTLGILAGIFTAIPAWVLGALFLAALMFLCFLRTRRIFIAALIFAAACLGAASWQLDHRRPAHSVTKFLEFKGTVEGIVKTRPYVKKRGKKEMTSFVLKTRWIHGKHNGQYETREVNGDVQVFLFQNKNKPRYGDRIKIYGKLESAKPAMNPGEFDYQKHLARQDIYAVLKSYGRNSVSILSGEEGPNLGGAAAFLQEKIEIKIDRLFPPDVKELLKALITGNRKDITSEVRDEFMRTGTSQVLATASRGILGNSFTSSYAFKPIA